MVEGPSSPIELTKTLMKSYGRRLRALGPGSWRSWLLGLLEAANAALATIAYPLSPPKAVPHAAEHDWRADDVLRTAARASVAFAVIEPM